MSPNVVVTENLTFGVLFLTTFKLESLYTMKALKKQDIEDILHDDQLYTEFVKEISLLCDNNEMINKDK